MRRNPGSVRPPHSAKLGHDHQIGGIGIEGLADQLVDDMGSIEIAGVDVVDPGLDRRPQHGQRGLAILRRPEYAGPGQLHGAKTHALDGPVAQTLRSGRDDVRHGSSP